MKLFLLAVLALTLPIGPTMAGKPLDPALGVAARLVGKTFESDGEKVAFSEQLGMVVIDIKGSWEFSVLMRGGIPIGTVKTIMSSMRAELSVGTGGIGLRHPFKGTVDYLILDRDGDLHHLRLAKGPGGQMVFKSYALLVDQARPDAAARTRRANTMRTVDPAVAARTLGFDPLSVGQELDGPAGEPTSTGPIAQASQIPPEAPVADARVPAGRRLALVIGNAAYAAAFGRLANPLNDANSVAAALRRSGFDVTVVTDGDQRTMKRAIAAFGQRLSTAGKGATGLFYYAGHGVQSRGVNYLVPVNAAIESEADVDIEAVAADSVLRQMEEAGAATNIVILDACRNLPITRNSRDGSRGLARMEAPNGSFVAYSTAPGATAADGTGANSPFATALVAEMGKAGQPIEAVFRNVRRNVLSATGGKQTPWDSSSLLDSFVFIPER